MNPPEPRPLPPEAPIFGEPWQARAFALAVALHQRGAFAWEEFARRLAAECASAPSGESAYWAAWLCALERLLDARGTADPAALAALADAWQRAAEATPHGVPIRLANLPPPPAASGGAAKPLPNL